ncbi:hypothetical protein R83H12_02592 [Fibrobacteria bacterium R8-3-H12]
MLHHAYGIVNGFRIFCKFISVVKILNLAEIVFPAIISFGKLIYLRLKIAFQFALGKAAQASIIGVERNILWLVHAAEQANLCEFGYAGYEYELNVLVAGFEDFVETFQFFFYFAVYLWFAYGI